MMSLHKSGYLFSAAVLAGAAAFVAPSASAAVIVNETFESYANTSELGAAWSLGDGTLAPSAGNPGQSLYHPGTSSSFSGGNTNSHGFTEVIPTDAEPLNFSVDIFDNGTSTNKRVSAGLRSSSGVNIIELGMYNNPNHYAYRTSVFGSGNTNWVAFSNIVDDEGNSMSNMPVAGWHRFSASITESQITFSLDLNSDGFINATSVASISLWNGYGFNTIRLGGPSDLGSFGGGAYFDNVLLQSGLISDPEPDPNAVPSPGAAGLAALGLAFIGLRRRRAR